MGKNGGNSWLNAVKKAFSRSDKTSISRRRGDHDQQDDTVKTRGKKPRWIFLKCSSNDHQHSDHHERNINVNSSANVVKVAVKPQVLELEDGKHAAVAVAVAVAAEAQASVERNRLTRRPTIFVRQHFAAIVIQTSFRGYLARRALRALRGLVKLQALVRGHNVRQRAKMTLQCMQSLVRVQERVCDRRTRLSQDNGSSTDSVFSYSNSFWDSHLTDKHSISRDESNVAEDWDEHSYTIEEIHDLLEKTREAALKRERSLAYAFSRQIRRTGRDSYASEGEREENPRSSHRLARDYHRETIRRASCDQRETIKYKNVEVDTSSFHPRRHSPTSPGQYQALNNIPPVSPLRSKLRLASVHSISPRCPRGQAYNDDVNADAYANARTPNLRYTYQNDAIAATMPNYMAATASAKARVRSQSAPRHRPSTPERERIGLVKKQLHFPILEAYDDEMSIANVRSDQNMRVTSYGNGYEGEFGDGVSSSLTSEVKGWLR